jgi:ABC-type transport system involved in multi-copper enzyme maturation permease subunit
VIAIWLIALNFVRQQRIVTYVFLAWVVGFGLLFGIWGGGDSNDVLALFQQQAAYGVVYTLFLAAASVQGERRSRRILAVLSKGIHRWEYIMGLMLGSVLMTLLYMVTLGLVNTWLTMRLGLRADLWGIVAAATLGAVVVSAIAIMFSTFAHPLLATIGTIIIAGLPAGMQAWRGREVGIYSPAAYVLQHIFRSDFANGWTGGWSFAFVAMLECLLFWTLAIVIFRKRDVTAAIE